ncbi:DUF6777 domain-containing protein [Streptomyces tsukubensis]|uniref:DUF6777 domain-containing protein n=1 Tax=Streptomyces tsukubensis TaxID=83656 RepID=A0A1V4A1L2_9ACTN|nr:DUF6777 domain-containing protein [Streptomyces tsukubensis]OON72708.1 hypothetical protein B1H18_28535 [Streptomyces tsukubensis]
MRPPIRISAGLAAISAAALAAGCSGADLQETALGGTALVLQPAQAQGADPFTRSTAYPAPAPPDATRSADPTPTDDGRPDVSGGATRTDGDGAGDATRADGGAAGLYGGTRATGSCDVAQQTRFLTEDTTKAEAFGRAAGIRRSAIPGYLRDLTPVVLRADTRVTGHGYRDKHATEYQAVLQTGTSVLVDRHGLPRVRCACGNPLAEPEKGKGAWQREGEPWDGYRDGRALTVASASGDLDAFTLVNLVDNTWISRDAGDDGGKDRVVREPGATAKGVPPVGPAPDPTAPEDPTRPPGTEETEPPSPDPSSPEEQEPDPSVPSPEEPSPFPPDEETRPTPDEDSMSTPIDRTVPDSGPRDGFAPLGPGARDGGGAASPKVQRKPGGSPAERGSPIESAHRLREHTDRAGSPTEGVPARPGPSGGVPSDRQHPTQWF